MTIFWEIFCFTLLIALLVICEINCNRKKNIYILADKDALIDDRMIDLLKFIKNIYINVIVPDFVKVEFEKMIESGQIDDWEIGNKALENMRKLQKDKKFNLILKKTNFPQNMHFSDKIIKSTQKQDCYLLTANFEIYVKASMKNLKIINIKFIDELSKKTIIPGDIIQVFVVTNENNDGVSFFADGTKIYIDECAKYVEKTLNCKVYKITKNIEKKIIYAKFLHLEE